jgi:molybdopterin synthase catalytic subunit
MLSLRIEVRKDVLSVLYLQDQPIMETVRVLFFATLKDRAGVKEISLELPDGARVSDLKAALVDRYPALRPAMSSSLVSVNQTYALDDDPVPEGAEVALFPPVSGGSQGSDPEGDPSPAWPTVFAITQAELDLNSLLAQITLPTTGAACFFAGMVRAVTERDHPHTTTYLEYEAYQPMAEAKMRQVAGEIRTRWPVVQGIAIVQRVGRLEPGTPTVLIGCTAAHRDTGVFEAASYGIDRLKEIVPVWKKEVSPDGEMWVEGEYVPGPGE